jgi:hypothetical protein
MIGLARSASGDELPDSDPSYCRANLDDFASSRITERKILG